MCQALCRHLLWIISYSHPVSCDITHVSCPSVWWGNRGSESLGSSPKVTQQVSRELGWDPGQDSSRACAPPQEGGATPWMFIMIPLAAGWEACCSPAPTPSSLAPLHNADWRSFELPIPAGPKSLEPRDPGHGFRGWLASARREWEVSVGCSLAATGILWGCTALSFRVWENWIILASTPLTPRKL